MKILFLALVIPVVAMGESPTRLPVVAQLPPNSPSPELVKLGLLIEARASELIETAGVTRELHLRQVQAMIRAEGLRPDLLGQSATAELARQALGADKVVATNLRRSGSGIVLEGIVVSAGKKTTFTRVLSSNWAPALIAGSEAIARALTGVSVPSTRAPPESASDGALMALADCWFVAIRQPLGIEEPVVIRVAELDAAIGSCQRAADQDPSLHFALATKALLQAIAGDDQGAIESMSTLDGSDEVVEAFTLARFWLLTRYQSNEAGLAYLSEARKKHPEELILVSTLAEDYGSLHDNVRAIDAWQTMLTLAPNSPNALGHLSEIVARSGRLEEGLSHAKRALALAPKSKAARLHVAARHLELGSYREAIRTLESLVNEPQARAEHVLKLGWAHWLNGDVKMAGQLFESAAKRAVAPDEWRTQGRAHYYRALVEARRGNVAGARSAMRSSRLTGLRIRDVDPSLSAFLSEPVLEGAPRPELERPPLLVPRESSLFPLDTFGDPEPAREKQPPPEGFILFRF